MPVGPLRKDILYGLCTVLVGLFERLVCYVVVGGRMPFLGFRVVKRKLFE